MSNPYLIPKEEVKTINECKEILQNIENAERLNVPAETIRALLEQHKDKLNNMPQYRYEEYTRAERIQFLMMKYNVQ